jgi:hypothetical protein
MDRELRVGDRVRVKAASRAFGYQPGDTGRVVWVSSATAAQVGPPLTLCAMDRTGPDQLAPFYPEEIERVP